MIRRFLLPALLMTPQELAASAIVTDRLCGTLDGEVALSGTLTGDVALEGALTGDVAIEGTLAGGVAIEGTLAGNVCLGGTLVVEYCGKQRKGWLTLQPGNTTPIIWRNMTDESSGAFVDDATVSARLCDSSGNPISGAYADLTSQGSDGNYRGILPPTELVAGVNGTLVVTAAGTAGNGQIMLGFFVSQRMATSC